MIALGALRLIKSEAAEGEIPGKEIVKNVSAAEVVEGAEVGGVGVEVGFVLVDEDDEPEFAGCGVAEGASVGRGVGVGVGSRLRSKR